MPRKSSTLVTLIDYIEHHGVAVVAKQLGVGYWTVYSWSRGRTLPRPTTAHLIVRKTPVTWAGIYKPN